MGSSSSKAARTAASSAPRRYPTRAPPSSITQATKSTPPPQSSEPPPPQQEAIPPIPPSPAGPTIHPPPIASETRNEAIDRDAADPVYSSNLRTLGAVQPNPILSHSSTTPLDPTTATSPSAASHAQRRPREQIGLFDGQALPASAFPQAVVGRANPAIRVLEAREAAQGRAEREFTGRGREGREFLDVGVVRQILVLRDKRGLSDEQVEKQLELKRGIVARLGPKGMVEAL